MLVLTRNRGECVRIGADITVKVVGVRGSQILIGVEAPREVVVLREELVRKRQRDAPEESREVDRPFSK